jgi:glycosyltransferase involved in cell wall biosynthesis
MEGFGLPPLEAMAYGKPVIVSDIPIFRELYGPYPYYVNLGDEASWEHAFSLVGEQDPEYGVRAAAHVQRFSIDKMSAALKSSLQYFWE